MRLIVEADEGSGGYRDLIAGLRAAQDLGATDVEVRMDSKLFVEQISGRCEVRYPATQPLAREATGLVGEINAQANQAMDAQAVR
jgi:ribonuclease H / adenosylcobalamin/alpha-ribazole phosphatase